MKKFTIYPLAVLSLSSSLSVAATALNTVHFITPKSLSTSNKPLVEAEKSKLVEMDIPSLEQQLLSAQKLSPNQAATIQLPMPDGSLQRFQITENNLMPKELAAKYPEIHAYDGISLDKPETSLKLDLGPKGLHGMIISPGTSPVFIDPYLSNDTKHYLVYHSEDFKTQKIMHCNASTDRRSYFRAKYKSPRQQYNSCDLKTFRLALSATYEYSKFTGGTKASALAAQVTTINRVNGVYETDLGVRMQLVPNNDALIVTRLPEPFSSGTVDKMIDENPHFINATIGAQNYDIGHVVDASPEEGGLAAVGAVCDRETKAMGATSLGSPIGDPFDIDFVAHELGHQFGANHTMNNDCNHERDTSVEPGSGSTIMGYAGVCPPDVQKNSHPYFHGISMEEIGDYLNENDNCSIRQPIPNYPPIIATDAAGYIPANTPFSLTATSGIVDSAISYTWEQMDSEWTKQPPVKTATKGPMFRSQPPSRSPTRYFPKLETLATGKATTWEVIPSESRRMSFRVSLRRNSAGGSCNAFQDIQLRVVKGNGAFSITYPNGSNIIWKANSRVNINWNVAKTNVAPIASPFVDVYLSTDGGQSFPITIAKNLPNTGKGQIIVPNLTSQKARIMVKSSNRNFFNVSTKDFTISP